MKDKKKVFFKLRRGGTTVFLAIIVPAIFLFLMVLMDAGRIYSAKQIAEKNVAVSLKSILADYDNILMEKYGLFAMPSNNLNEKIIEYIENGFPKSGVDFYDFKIENVRIEELEALSDKKELKRQIVEYMKLQAPTSIIFDILNKTKMFADIKQRLDSFSKKIKLDKLLNKLEQTRKQIEDSLANINESVSELSIYKNLKVLSEKCFNGIGMDQKTVMDMSSRIETTIEKAFSAKEQLQDFIKDMENSKCEIEKTSKEESFEEFKAPYYSEQLNWKSEGLLKKIDILSNNINLFSRMKSQISVFYNLNQELSKLISQQNELTSEKEELQVNQNGVTKKILEITRNKRDIENAIEKLTNKSKQNIKKDELKTIIEELEIKNEELKVLIEEIRIQTNNSSIYEKSIEKLEITSTEMGIRILKLKETLIEELRVFESIENDIKSIEIAPEINTEEWKEDPRTTVANEANNILKYGIEVNSSSEIINKSIEAFSELLPSAMNMKNEIKLKSNLVDFTTSDETKSDFSQDAIAENSNLLNALVYAKDNIYINEYILNKLKFRTKEKANQDANQKTNVISKNEFELSKDFSIDEKNGLVNRSFFKECEAEYILGGQKDEEGNKKAVENKILLTRLAINTLYLYTDKVKNSTAMNAAIAAAGWTGLGVPILHTFIMLSWSMAESIYDLKDLTDGMLVPIMKNEQTWKLGSLNSIKNLVSGLSEKLKTNSTIDDRTHENKTLGILSMNYKDYLRLFLLAIDQDTKLTRLQDIIQLNMVEASANNEFTLDKCKTFFRVQVQISIRKMVIPKIGVINKKGRQVFDLVAYEKFN